MKPAVAVALIVMGTLLILAPIGADYLFQREVVDLLLKGQSASVTLTGKLSDIYRVVTWLTGSLMIAVGALGAVMDARESYMFDAEEEVEEE